MHKGECSPKVGEVWALGKLLLFKNQDFPMILRVEFLPHNRNARKPGGYRAAGTGL